MDQTFTYLTPSKPHGNQIFDPFALEIVGHQEVDQNNFYTLSAAGITHYCDGEADFMTAETFLQEFHMFLKIRTMPVFSKFYLWRAFKGWKSFVVAKKQNEAKSEIGDRVYVAAPQFTEGLLAVRHACASLAESWRPFDLEVRALLSRHLCTGMPWPQCASFPAAGERDPVARRLCQPSAAAAGPGTGPGPGLLPGGDPHRRGRLRGRAGTQWGR